MARYPIIDEDRRHYVKYPVKRNGDWYAADVKKEGWTIPPMSAQHKTEQDCQKACDVHNDYHEWTDDDVISIICASMGLESWNGEYIEA